MKKTVIVLLAMVFTASIKAQIKTPQPSPFQKIEQKVGLTDITLEYSRPGVKGRTIFGGLVPYGKVWRTGANENTKITFSTNVSVNGQKLKKGTYAIYTKPTESSWEVYFYADATNWGNPRKWDDNKVAAKTTAQVYPMPMKIETFTMTFDDVTNNSTNLGMLWEKAYISVTISVPTDAMVDNSIKRVMGGPQANDYYAAAVYYLESGKNITQAQKWIDTAVQLTKKEPRFWYLRQQSLIHAKAGNKKTAIKAAKESIKHAEKAGNTDYIKLNKASLKAWGAE